MAASKTARVCGRGLYRLDEDGRCSCGQWPMYCTCEIDPEWWGRPDPDDAEDGEQPYFWN